MSPPMHLHELPPELLNLLLHSLDSLQDLQSLIQASAHCFRIFRLSPEPILSSILKNAIHPAALHDALAVLYIRTHPATEWKHHETLWDFLDEYFQHTSILIEFPRDMAGIISLARLHAQVSRLANDYSCQALQALYSTEDISQSSSCYAIENFELSTSEKGRIQRAFFRYELYSRCFPVNPRKEVESVIPADAQLEHFILRMSPWEVEELSCLHDYFLFRLATSVGQMENEIVEKVLQAASKPDTAENASTPDCKRKYSPTNTDGDDSKQLDANVRLRKYTSHGGDDRMCLFEKLDLRGLDMFSDEGRRTLPHIIRYMASLGLNFLESVFLAQDNERRDLIRRKYLGPRDFLPQAIAQGPDLPLQPNGSKAPVDNDICHINLGYHVFRPRSTEVYLSAMSIADYWPLRRLGYVFWDVERVLSPRVDAKLRNAKNYDPEEADEEFNGPLRRSAESRLKGVALPQTLMREIENDYRYDFDPNAYGISDSEEEDDETNQ